MDKQLNLIKEYYKISENAKEFKRNIKKQTKFDGYQREVEVFARSKDCSEELLMVYRRMLWNTEMPRFFEGEPLVLESPKVRQMKALLKQLEAKRQGLNEVLKEKEKVVVSLGGKSRKLQEQVEGLVGRKGEGGGEGGGGGEGLDGKGLGGMGLEEGIGVKVDWGFYW